MSELKPESSNIPEKSMEEKKWDELYEELTELRNTVYEKAKEKMGKKAGNWFYKKTEEFGTKVKVKIPDFMTYIGWYRLSASSGIKREEAPNLDLPEPYSAKTFLLGLLEELEQMKDKKEKE